MSFNIFVTQLISPLFLIYGTEDGCDVLLDIPDCTGIYFF